MIYLNIPDGGNLREWLSRESVSTARFSSDRKPDREEVSVCLINRGAWLMACVVSDLQSFDELNVPDSAYDARPRDWYRVEKVKLEPLVTATEFERIMKAEGW